MLRNLVTLEQLSLLPAGSDDGAAPLSGFELAAGAVAKFGHGFWAEVRQGMALKPSPQIFHRIKFWGVAGKELQGDGAIGGVDVVAHQTAAMRFGAIQHDEQPPAVVGFECFEKFEDLFFTHRAFIQAKAHALEMHPGNDRDVIPVEAELHRRRVAS